MCRSLLVSLVLIVGTVWPVGAYHSVDQPPLLNLPLFPVPVSFTKIPITKALAEVGIRLRNGYVLFGIEVYLENGSEPMVDVKLKPPASLGEALRQIFRQIPEYKFEVISDHLINVYPSLAKQDPFNVLNTRVQRFEVVDEQADGILYSPGDFIPELNERLIPKRGPPQPSGYSGPGLRSIGPGVTLHLENVTVRQVLNAVSEATTEFPANYSPLGWVYLFEPDPTSPVGGKHSWTVHWSAPSTWKEKSENAPRR